MSELPPFKIPLGIWDEKAAELVWKEAVTNPAYADGKGTRLEAKFNDVPMIAYATDAHPQVVFVRYKYERLIRQYKAGYLKLEDLGEAS